MTRGTSKVGDQRYRAIVSNLRPLALLHDQPTDAIVTVRATLRSLQLKRNALGRLWAILELEQSGSTATVLVFPQTFATISADTLRPDALLEFDARILLDRDGKSCLTPVTTPMPAL